MMKNLDLIANISHRVIDELKMIVGESAVGPASLENTNLINEFEVLGNFCMLIQFVDNRDTRELEVLINRFVTRLNLIDQGQRDTNNYSLSSGRFGFALIYLELYKVSKDRCLLEKSIDIAFWKRYRPFSEAVLVDNCSFYEGRGGVVFFYVSLYVYCREPWLSDAIFYQINCILRELRVSPQGFFFGSPSSLQLGIRCGNAGVALVLIECSRIFNRYEWLDVALGLLLFERQWIMAHLLDDSTEKDKFLSELDLVHIKLSMVQRRDDQVDLFSKQLQERCDSMRMRDGNSERIKNQVGLILYNLFRLTEQKSIKGTLDQIGNSTTVLASAVEDDLTKADNDSVQKSTSIILRIRPWEFFGSKKTVCFPSFDCDVANFLGNGAISESPLTANKSLVKMFLSKDFGISLRLLHDHYPNEFNMLVNEPLSNATQAFIDHFSSLDFGAHPKLRKGLFLTELFLFNSKETMNSSEYYDVEGFSSKMDLFVNRTNEEIFEAKFSLSRFIRYWSAEERLSLDKRLSDEDVDSFMKEYGSMTYCSWRTREITPIFFQPTPGEKIILDRLETSTSVKSIFGELMYFISKQEPTVLTQLLESIDVPLGEIEDGVKQFLIQTLRSLYMEGIIEETLVDD